jgi:ribosomal protein S18 acetylase RimI-like enzyme
MQTLLDQLQPMLPRQIYAHLTPPLEDTLATVYTVAAHGLHHKMALQQFDAVDATDTNAAKQLTVADRPALDALYAASYPGNWFDARMLETGQYVGLWRDGALVSVAGIHVFSETYSVAALGNVTTHPDYRGQGLATVATAALCKQLRERVAHISLNVHRENTSAIRAYERLGFERVAVYGEYTLT